MDLDVWETNSISDDEVASCYKDEDEEDHYDCGSAAKLQFRKEISKARWDEKMGMAEVVEKKGKMWTSTGINRNGKTYCLIEETLFLSEVGALCLLDEGDNSCTSLKDLYQKVAEGINGCDWECYEVYRHLKTLGYIVGRHGIPWTIKKVNVDRESVSLEGGSEVNETMSSKDEDIVVNAFNEMKINEGRPVFDVFLPNSKFRKSSPGDPSFVLCLTRGYPPTKAGLEVLERQLKGFALKFCHVEYGRVTFFSFDSVDLPVLP